MRIMKILWVSFTPFFVLFLASCNDKKDEAISFPLVENNSLSLTYPYDGIFSTNLAGGDGNYSVSCSDEKVLDAKLADSQEGKVLELTLLSTGAAVVTVVDGSGHSTILNVDVSYQEFQFVVLEHNLVIEGNISDTTVQNELRETALSTIPVRVDGAYRFVFKDVNRSRGDVYFENGKYQEGTFTVSQVVDAANGETATKYTIRAQDETHELIMLAYSSAYSLKSSPVLRKFLFAEDLTDIYQQKYPELKHIRTIQEIEFE